MFITPARNTSAIRAAQSVLPVNRHSRRAVLIGSAVVVTLLASVPLGMLDLARARLVVGVVITLYLVAVLIKSRQDALIAAGCVGIGVFIDWYHFFTLPSALQIPVAALPALALVGCRLLRWPSARSWVSLPDAWLWGLLMILAAPAILSGVDFAESLAYYGNIMVVPLLMYLLGMVVARDMGQVRRLLSFLAGLSTLIAIHTLIEAHLGIFLLQTPFVRAFLATNSYFPLTTGSQVLRAGSLLLNPDANGLFLAVAATLPVGLFLASPGRVAKALYAGETALMLVALLDTYTVGAFAALGGALLVFIWLVGSHRTRLSLLALLGALVAACIIAFPAQIGSLFQHATAQGELSQRIGIWQTAIRVIQANPLTGIGLGQSTYMARGDFYHVPLQQGRAPTPHDSYLELAALAGIPVLVMFLVILGSAFWRILRVSLRAEKRYRLLLASVVAAAVTLSCNSLEGMGWTLRPVAWMVWVLLGAVSSPLLAQALETADRTEARGAARAELTTPGLLGETGKGLT